MSCFCIGPQCFSLSAVSNSERKLLDNAMSPRAMYGANRQETASRFEALRLYLPTDTSWAACRTQNGPMSIVNLIAFVRWISSGGWFGYHTLHSSPQPQIADSISNYVPNVCLWPNRKCTNWMQKKKLICFIRLVAMSAGSLTQPQLFFFLSFVSVSFRLFGVCQTGWVMLGTYKWWRSFICHHPHFRHSLSLSLIPII